MGWSELDLHQFHSDEKILQLTREVELLKYQVNHNEVELLKSQVNHNEVE